MAYRYKIDQLKFTSGESLKLSDITVLVGPNNAGKSRILKDILALAARRNPQSPAVVVSEIEAIYPDSLEELRNAYDVERIKQSNNQWSFRILHPTLLEEFQLGSGGNWPANDERVFSEKNAHFPKYFSEHFGASLLVSLETESRLQLVREGQGVSERRQAATLLQVLYNAGRDAELAVRKVMKATFGREVALDFTLPTKLQLRVGEDFSRLPLDPRDARQYLQDEARLDDQGDGIRSFAGIAVALTTLNRPVILVDEPEAFLHPPQAYQVGALLAENKDRQIIVATHSSDVLRGILSRTRDVGIVRVERDGNVNRIKPLEAARLQQIINDPLLTSARVLEGLFYGAAVVVEADADARFYHAVSSKRDSRMDLHFVNADNKQTVSQIMRLYQDMGVRCAGIVDIDYLNERHELSKSLELLGFTNDEAATVLAEQSVIAEAVKELPSEARLDSIRVRLGELVEKCKQTDVQNIDSLLRQLASRFSELSDMTKPWKEVKQKGPAVLSERAKASFEAVLAICARRGMFINTVGELEGMLADYGIKSTNDKRGWIIQALQLVGGLQVDDSKNPWKFVAQVQQFLSSNPQGASQVV